jgi:uncharacterized membrane-anchored protein
MAMLAFFAALGILYLVSVPEANKGLITFMLGQLSGAFGMALAYYFSTTQGSARKDETIAQLALRESIVSADVASKE